MGIGYRSLRLMGQMGHGTSKSKVEWVKWVMARQVANHAQTGKTDTPMGQMGQWVMTFFFAPTFAPACPAAIAVTVSPIKQTSLQMKLKGI
jgi:hypothetical protein